MSVALDFKKDIQRGIQENIEVQKLLLKTCVESIELCAKHFLNTLKKNGKILFCGNGGSAADSQHMAAELIVRLRSTFNRPALPALALTVDSSILTSCGNDFGFDMIFARQIEALGKPQDLLVAISTSGNSTDVIEAVNMAHEKSMFVVGFLGGDGGKLARLVDLPIIVPSRETARIQEAHTLIGHIVCQLVETKIFR